MTLIHRCRHNRDDSIPITEDDVIHTNHAIVRHMVHAFPHTPVIPNIGNHDLFKPSQLGLHDTQSQRNLAALYKAWYPFVPVEQRDAFRRHGCFYRDVVPQRLRILSLNTLPLYKPNRKVKSCRHDASYGRLVLTWLEETLHELADLPSLPSPWRVYIVGHVPPVRMKRMYFKSCLKRYHAIVATYSSSIAGQFFGHTNKDAFALLSRDISLDTHRHRPGKPSVSDHTPISFGGKHRGPKDETRFPRNKEPFAVLHMSPSVLPVYNPSYRIYTYSTDSDGNAFGSLLRYDQFFANLTALNVASGNASVYSQTPIMEIPYALEYASDRTYGLKDLSPGEYKAFFHRLSRNPRLLDLYEKHFYVSYTDRHRTMGSESMHV